MPSAVEADAQTLSHRGGQPTGSRGHSNRWDHSVPTQQTVSLSDSHCQCASKSFKKLKQSKIKQTQKPFLQLLTWKSTSLSSTVGHIVCTTVGFSANYTYLFCLFRGEKTSCTLWIKDQCVCVCVCVCACVCARTRVHVCTTTNNQQRRLLCQITMIVVVVAVIVQTDLELS